MSSNSSVRARCFIGVDYGTLSGPAAVVRVSDGEELGSATLDCPHAAVSAGVDA